MSVTLASIAESRHDYGLHFPDHTSIRSLEQVTIVRTIGAGVARELMEAMEGADAVLVAGGDGTVMEAVTGMLRRKDKDSFCRRVMVGVIPVGANNHTARFLFPEMHAQSSATSEVKFMAEATMSVIRNHYRSVDVLEVRNASTEGPFGGWKLHGLRQVGILMQL